MNIKIAPSILSADFANLQRDIARISTADYVHVDVMDGIFVPNISIGLPVVRAIRPTTQLPLDVHLMIVQPARYAAQFCDAGADIVTCHVEADTPENIHAAIDKIHDKGYTLIVTVDNGISAVEEAAYAASLGIDLVITDHHLPPSVLPAAVAVVDPRRADDESPFKDLCGAGVAFKLCAALEDCMPEELLEFCSELAAIGTVADVMPLNGENRTIVKAGLQILQNVFRRWGL